MRQIMQFHVLQQARRQSLEAWKGQSEVQPMPSNDIKVITAEFNNTTRLFIHRLHRAENEAYNKYNRAKLVTLVMNPQDYIQMILYNKKRNEGDFWSHTVEFPETFKDARITVLPEASLEFFPDWKEFIHES